MGYKTQGTDYPKFFGLSGIALSRMIGFAAGAGFVSVDERYESLAVTTSRRQ